MKRLSLLTAAMGITLVFQPVSALAGVIVNSPGTFRVGIGPNGELFDAPSGTGFLRLAGGYDPLAPGTPRDSWGISAGANAAVADGQFLGSSGVTTTSTFGPNSATLVTTTTFGLTITQTYTFAANNVLEVNGTVTNTGALNANNVLFQRDIDWDITPNLFNETSFGQPISGFGNVVASTFNGFENGSPLVPFGNSCNAGCVNTGDNGGGIRIALGTLTPGSSASFEYFYGINNLEQNVSSLISEVNGLGGNYYIATVGTASPFNSAIIAVASPEPSTLAFMAIGLGLTAIGVRRRRAARK